MGGSPQRRILELVIAFVRSMCSIWRFKQNPGSIVARLARLSCRLILGE